MLGSGPSSSVESQFVMSVVLNSLHIPAGLLEKGVHSAEKGSPESLVTLGRGKSRAMES